MFGDAGRGLLERAVAITLKRFGAVGIEKT